MKILVVNDDSINAPGIALLAKAAAQLGEVWVAAPAEQCSAMSQKLTLREPLTVEKVDDFPVAVKAAYKIGGTPVDCIKVALEYLLDERPDYVFSGINNGYNVGFDIAYSGTLGAAFEAVRNGIPAMAFSIANESWLDQAEASLTSVIQELLDADLKRCEVWNVNYPAMRNGAPKGILRERAVAPVSMFREKYVETRQADGTVILTSHGVPTEDALIPAGTDAEAVRKGYISIGKVKCAVL